MFPFVPRKHEANKLFCKKHKNVRVLYAEIKHYDWLLQVM